MSATPESAYARVLAPAKINLGLHVLRRRYDGYHDIETVLFPIGWHDTLRIEDATTFRFTCSDPSLPTDERNLCVRAALTLAERAGVPARGWLHLDKRVPHGAGLGGGSSDAARTLSLLTDFWGLAVDDDVLYDLAVGLGSDVPFFLHDEPKLATERGDVLTPLAEDGYRLPYALAIVMPAVHVSTMDAYALVTPRDGDRPDLNAIVCSNDLDWWRRELVNDFEEPILAAYPEIRVARQRLLDAGAGYVAMSGSGAAVYGVFECDEDAQGIAEAARSEGASAWWTSFVSV